MFGPARKRRHSSGAVNNEHAQGQAAQRGPLVAYAASLTTCAYAYAVGQMERHLAEFPQLVESIETSLAHQRSHDAGGEVEAKADRCTDADREPIHQDKGWEGKAGAVSNDGCSISP